MIELKKNLLEAGSIILAQCSSEQVVLFNNELIEKRPRKVAGDFTV